MSGGPRHDDTTVSQAAFLYIGNSYGEVYITLNRFNFCTVKGFIVD